jgi:hypothetical protein
LVKNNLNINLITNGCTLIAGTARQQVSLPVVDRRPIGLINCMKEKSINCIKIKSNCIEAKKQKHKSHCINSIKAN